MGKYIKRKAMSVVPPAAGTISDSVNVIDEKTTAPSIDLTKRITGIPVDGVIIYEGDELNIPEGYEKVNSGMFLPIGAGCDFYGATAPDGFMFADGSAISRIKYAQLFKIIGTLYGEGDGSTTFNLPDKRNRVSVSASMPNLYDMKTKTLSDGSKWARIFYHNSKSGTVVFSGISEARNVQGTDKYSRLYLLDDDTFKNKIDNKFEFMLCYPTYTTNYNRWKQTNSPTKEYINSEAGTTVTGYEAVSIAWTANYWGGIQRHNSSTTEITNYCYLTGSIQNNSWWYAIAPIVAYQGGVPGPDNVVITTDVELWVRYDNLFCPGDTGGEFSHILTIDEMPSHTHTLTRQQWYSGDTVTNADTGSIYSWKTSSGGSTSAAYARSNYSDLSSVGNGQSHNNMQPYLICNYIIRVE